jgi:hypothetical protein
VVNSNVESYVVKFEGRLLDLDKTLSENSIPSLAKTNYIPTIILYYTDNFE